MAFKGLSDRYEQTYKDLYELPVKTQEGEEPFLSFRPDDPKRNQTNNDTPQMFLGTIERETLRLGRYLKSSRGTMFLLRQAELQTGNTFSETRLFNPLFVGSLIVPFTHIRRTLDSALDKSVGEDTGRGISFSNIANASITGNSTKSPGSDNTIGAAGRLQIATKNKVIADRMGAKGGTGLLNLLLPGNPLSRAVSGIMNSVGERGIVGVDGRPELDFQGEYFSVATWRGFSSQGKDGDPVKSATDQLLKGNIKGAGQTLLNGLKTKVFGSAGQLGTLTNTTGGRGGKSTQYAGYRYFVTNGPNETAVDRYLIDTITFESVPTGVVGKSTIVPRASMNAFVRAPHVRVMSTTNAQKKTTSPAKTAISKAKNDINKILKTITKVAGTLFGSSAASKVNQFISPLQAKTITVDTSNPNPGRSRMIYPELSLEARYEAQRQTIPTGMGSADATIPSKTDEQIVNWKKTYNPTSISSFGGFRGIGESNTYGKGKFAGFQGGLAPDYQSNLDSVSKTKAPYYIIRDPLNNDATDPIFINDGNSVSENVLKQIRDIGGNLIDFMFYDVVNSAVLPFRAFLTDINESVTPNFSEQQYIGRIERNVVYVGVVRELSFTFRVQAFSSSEMSNVWTKINYLTGLAYPAEYRDGFLVPPMVKLTIGNFYKDQPGYLKSLSYKLDDDDWEIDPDAQVPMGVTVNVSFSVIEKQQMSTQGMAFYPANASITMADPNHQIDAAINAATSVKIDIPDIVIPSSIPGLGSTSSPNDFQFPTINVPTSPYGPGDKSSLYDFNVKV